MAKDRRKWRPGLKKVCRKSSQHAAGPRRSSRSNIPEAISRAVQEVGQTTGHEAGKIVELQRTNDGGWLIVAETRASTGDPAVMAEQYFIRLTGEGNIISYELAGRETPSRSTGSTQRALPVDLGLRAELDTDIAISFRRINVVNLRLRGSIRPLRNKGKRP